MQRSWIRIKTTVALTMYDMNRFIAHGYFAAEDSAAVRPEKRKVLSVQRTADYRNGTYERMGGIIDPVPDDAPSFVKDYHAYHKTKRGYHSRSLNSNEGWAKTGCSPFLNQFLLCYTEEIQSAVLVVHGEKAHFQSRRIGLPPPCL